MKFSELKSDVARVDFLKEQLTSDDRLIMRTLFAIYSNQTHDEQMRKDVEIHNGIGFKVQDAKILTEYAVVAMNRGAVRMIANKALPFKLENVLSPKQSAYLKRCMPKYARQLLKVIKEKQTTTQGA